MLMAVYFFNLHNDIISVDEEGSEFPDLASALAKARADAVFEASQSVEITRI